MSETWRDMKRWKDTVANNEKNDKVDADNHVGEDRATIGHDAIIHHRVPVLSCKNLQTGAEKERNEQNIKSTDAWIDN